MPLLNDIHHVTFIIADLDWLIAFYERVFGAHVTVDLEEEGLRHAFIEKQHLPLDFLWISQVALSIYYLFLYSSGSFPCAYSPSSSPGYSLGSAAASFFFLRRVMRWSLPLSKGKSSR